MAIHLRKVAVRAWLTLMAVVSGLLVILAVGLGFLLGTETGRVMLVDQTEYWLPRLTDQRLEVRGARSPSLGAWRFDRLVWQVGSGGPEVIIEDLTFDWQPRFLWQRRLWVDQLHAASAEVRLPGSGASDRTTAPSEPLSLTDIQALWPRIPPVRLQRLAIDRLAVQRPTGPPLVTSVNSEVEVNWGDWPAHLEMSLAEGSASQLSLSVSVDAVDALRVSGHLRTPGDSAWAEWMQWPLPRQPLAGSWDILLRDEGEAVSAEIDHIEWPWQGHELAVEGGASYNTRTERVFLSELDISADGHPARLHGFLEANDASLGVTVDAWPLMLVRDLLPVSDLAGELSVDGRLTGGWAQPRFEGEASLDGSLMGDALTVSTRSSATPDGLELDRFQARWGEAEVEAAGKVHWSDRRLALDLEWRQLSRDRWQPWVPQWPEELDLTTAGQGRIEGGFDAPTASASVTATGEYRGQRLDLDTELSASRDRVEVTGLSLATALGQLEGRFELDLDTLGLAAETRLTDIQSEWLGVMGIDLPVEQDWELDGNLAWSGTLTDPLAQGDITLAGSWQQRPLEARLAIEALSLAQVELADSRLALADAETGVAGRVNWQQQTLDLQADIRSLQLATLEPFLPVLPPWLEDLEGNATGALTASGPWLEPRIRGDLAFDGRWLERPLTASVRVEAPDREQLTIEQAELAWSDLRLGYQGEVRPFEPSLDGAFTVEGLAVSDLRRLPFSLPADIEDLSGTGRASGLISGNLSAPQISGEAGFRGQWQQAPLELDLVIENLTPERVSLTSARLQSGNATLVTRGDIAFQPLTLALDAELVELDWARVKPWVPASLGVPLDSLEGRVSGRFSVDGGWPGLALEGTIESTGDYRAEAYQLTWTGSGSLSDQFSHDLSLSWGEARLEAQVQNEGQQINGEMVLERVRVDQLRALGVPLEPGIDGGGSARIQVGGELGDPSVDARIEASGRWQRPTLGPVDDQWEILVEADGRLDDWRITTARADLGPAGSLSARGEGTSEQVDLTVEVDVPRTGYWLGDDSPGAGSLRGDFRLAGTPASPQVSADIDWESTQWPIVLALAVATESGEHRVNLALNEGDTERLGLDLVTAQTALSEWTQGLSQRAFDADLALNADSTVFAPLFQQRPDQDFSGQVTGQLSITGTLARPEWEGSAELVDGRYENASYGTVLADMDASLTANNLALDFSMNAGDDNGGTVTFEGAVVWPEERAEWWMPELDLVMNARNAHLVRRADMDASVGGELTVSGPWKQLVVAGEVDVTPLTIQLNSLLQSGAPTLNVVRAGAESDNEDAASTPASAGLYAPEGEWQVRIRANRRAQIYGRGLEAELSGELDLTDELANPTVGGRFEVIRGTYTAFGKIFQIEQGNIQIQGSQIVLDIQAVYEGPELTVTLNISGSQDRLDLSMTSSPPLANDELMARLLFGRRLEEMTAFQALQLASALNALRDPGSGLDLFGTTRDLLGLDALTVDSGTNEQGETGVNVAAGKYLSDRIYLEVESGVRTDQGLSGSLQFQITPRVSLELYSSTSEVGSGGLLLNWKNDY